jgi:hypothetical protein
MEIINMVGWKVGTLLVLSKGAFLTTNGGEADLMTHVYSLVLVSLKRSQLMPIPLPIPRIPMELSAMQFKQS